MSIFYILFLAIVQGLTEFLPVSSSAHLILAPYLMDVPDQGYEIDLAVHVGSLFAVMIYFKRETFGLISGAFDTIRLRFSTPESKFFILLVIATIPVIIFGVILELMGLIDALRSPKIIAITMILFGVILYIADKFSKQDRIMDDWNLRDAVIMGLWQAIALIPGTSRSGATVTSARFLGFDRRDGAKIAMLMSIPTILAGGALLSLQIIKGGNVDTTLLKFAAIAAGASFIAALLALSLMMKFLKSADFTPYVIYRIILGVVLLALVW